MLIKCALMQCIERIDLDGNDMIWVELPMYAGVKIEGVYIPPENSLYSTVMPHRCKP